jgi:hypothetical protein
MTLRQIPISVPGRKKIGQDMFNVYVSIEATHGSSLRKELIAHVYKGAVGQVSPYRRHFFVIPLGEVQPEMIE